GPVERTHEHLLERGDAVAARREPRDDVLARMRRELDPHLLVALRAIEGLDRVEVVVARLPFAEREHVRQLGFRREPRAGRAGALDRLGARAGVLAGA